MHSKNLLVVLISTVLSFGVTAQSSVKFETINTEWLTGDQPKLLTMMANTPTAREGLIGTGRDATTILGGWHAQAVGQYSDFIYVAFSDGKLLEPKVLAEKKDQSDTYAKLWVYNTKTKEGQLVDLEKGYPHPCSIQVTGKYLTIAIEAAYGTNQEIGIERIQRSMIQIYDLEKDPYCSVEVSRIVQDNMNCGGAGIAFNPQTKTWFMLADQDYKEYKDAKVALYKTKSEDINSWIKEPIAYYQRFGSGAGMNLITASDNSIWGLYYDTNDSELPSFSQWMMSGDEVKLFKLVEPNGTPVAQRQIYSQIVTLESPKLKTAGELLADRPGMRFGAGIRMEGGQLELITCQRNMSDVFNINRSVLKVGERTQVVFTNLSRSRGEMICSSLSNTSQSEKVQKLQTESWNGVFQPPVKADLNYMAISKKSFGSLSVPKMSDAFEGQSSAPLVLFYLEGNDPVGGKMVEFKTRKNTDKKL